MKLGLLKCDPRPFEALYAAWLPDVEWRVYEVHLGQLPSDLAECDAWVGTGSRYSVYDEDPWISAYADLVRAFHEAGTPFLGVCFGHQMIARALGGRVERHAEGWCVGVHQFQVHHTEPWMQPPLREFGIVMSCQDQVKALPPGSTLLASNAACPVGMFQVGRMLAIQGHPEYLPDYARTLMESRRERIGADRIDAGLASLSQPRHSVELAKWALQFFRFHTTLVL